MNTSHLTIIINHDTVTYTRSHTHYGKRAIDGDVDRTIAQIKAAVSHGTSEVIDMRPAELAQQKREEIIILTFCLAAVLAMASAALYLILA